MHKEEPIELEEGQIYTFKGVSFWLKQDQFGAVMLYSDDPAVQFGSVSERHRGDTPTRSAVIIRHEAEGCEENQGR
ncbi:MAG: hypothetical protein M3220_08365 [Chloroflexota bacterium]|nr:hypothetical protein [Chloroflexota bacterium]